MMSAQGKATPHAEDAMEGYVGPSRKMGPVTREGISHRVSINGLRGYITANRHEDGTLREVFIHGFGSHGSTLNGWVQSFAIMLSIALQYGTELPMLARKFAHMRFEPNGETDNPDVPWCASVPHYMFNWLALHFGDEQLRKELVKINAEMRGLQA